MTEKRNFKKDINDFLVLINEKLGVVMSQVESIDTERFNFYARYAYYAKDNANFVELWDRIYELKENCDRMYEAIDNFWRIYLGQK